MPYPGSGSRGPRKWLRNDSLPDQLIWGDCPFHVNVSWTESSVGVESPYVYGCLNWPPRCIERRRARDQSLHPVGDACWDVLVRIGCHPRSSHRAQKGGCHRRRRACAHRARPLRLFHPARTDRGAAARWFERRADYRDAEKRSGGCYARPYDYDGLPYGRPDGLPYVRRGSRRSELSVQPRALCYAQVNSSASRGNSLTFVTECPAVLQPTRKFAR